MTWAELKDQLQDKADTVAMDYNPDTFTVAFDSMSHEHRGSSEPAAHWWIDYSNTRIVLSTGVEHS